MIYLSGSVTGIQTWALSSKVKPDVPSDKEGYAAWPIVTTELGRGGEKWRTKKIARPIVTCNGSGAGKGGKKGRRQSPHCRTAPEVLFFSPKVEDTPK